MEEENFNWLEAYITASEGKDIKNSKAFKILNENNIDTNELTKHDKDKDAGVIELNYKDEKEKEVDGINFGKGLLAFIADMPEETVKALMLAALNGTDVAANVVGVAFNAMTNVDPAMQAAFQKKDLKEFKKLVNKNIQDFSKYLSEQKEDVKKIGEGSELNSTAAMWVSMVMQDTPYSLPIYKKFKSMGVPTYVALPVAYGMGSSISFSDDATLFLNSEQVQEFKKMVVDLENSSEEKIFNTTFRMVEGTGLGFLTGGLFKSLKFAKNNIPKFNTKRVGEAVGLTATGGAVVKEVLDNQGNNIISKETENK